MKIEIRNDRVIIDGYVNAVGRDSRPIMPKSALFPDKCVEQVVPGTFKKSLEHRSEVDLLINHDRNRKLGSTAGGELALKEDAIGLRAHAVITDPAAIEKARNGEFTGWSFGMYVGGEEREERAGDIPRRRLTDIDLFEVSLIDRSMQPCYAGTLVECRADGATVSETRLFEDEVEFENGSAVPEGYYEPYEKLLAALRAAGEIADAERWLAELRYNHNHDPTTGRFTSGGGSSSKSLTSGGAGDIIKKSKPLGYTAQSNKSLEAGIKSEQKQIEKHKEKISNPQNYVSDWNEQSDFYKNGIIKHWEKEIKNFEKQIQFRQEELNRRKK
ncbi:MAG: HK97 family phage prohead protease [Prevotella sp.]|nr:HK97 family phage prohead protease [Prevotella sp.]